MVSAGAAFGTCSGFIADGWQVCSTLVLVTAVLGVINPLLVQVVFDDALFPGGRFGTGHRSC